MRMKINDEMVSLTIWWVCRSSQLFPTQVQVYLTPCYMWTSTDADDNDNDDDDNDDDDDQNEE